MTLAVAHLEEICRSELVVCVWPPPAPSTAREGTFSEALKLECGREVTRRVGEVGVRHHGRGRRRGGGGTSTRLGGKCTLPNASGSSTFSSRRSSGTTHRGYQVTIMAAAVIATIFDVPRRPLRRGFRAAQRRPPTV